jgi:type IV pilus assembly protein PilA
MILKLRQRMAQEESGFTLVELLVVMLILGLLAAIAIPAFFNQQSKAKDADAKAAVRTAETAMETFRVSHNGSYADANVTAGDADSLQEIESTLNDVGTRLTLPAAPTDNTYTVQVESEGDAGNLFQISRAADGTTSLDCGSTAGVPPTGTGKDGCPSSGDWGGG